MNDSEVTCDAVKAMRKYAMNSLQFDKLEIKDDNETLTVPAVIARESVIGL
jgi:hypothetical protein